MILRKRKAYAHMRVRRDMKQIIEEYGICAVLIFLGGVILELMQELFELI